ncbi:MAG: glycerate kinase [Polyangiaceae bacterium]|nr:glycerate kinase [Polyangiaceae bacterium]
MKSKRAPTVLIAPQAFKGSLGPLVVAEAMKRGVRRAIPNAEVVLLPVADGGDGLIDVLRRADSQCDSHEVRGPLGEPAVATILWLDSRTAVIESAAACGLRLLDPSRLDPLRASTFGVGELMNCALSEGALTIIVGLGGSATVDVGLGMASALGWRFLDRAGEPVRLGGGHLGDVESVVPGTPFLPRVIALADVNNPLTGPNGTVDMFAAQKGAGRKELSLLSGAVVHLASLLRAEYPEFGNCAGAGAAGGLAAGLATFLSAEVEPGATWVMRRLGFEARLREADLVLTGEGSFDETSLLGKGTGRVVELARARGVAVAVVAGRGTTQRGVRVYAGSGEPVREPDIVRLSERAVMDAFPAR